MARTPAAATDSAPTAGVVSSKKIKLTFQLECRNCNTSFFFQEGELLHERCSFCGKGHYTPMVNNVAQPTVTEIWRVRESGEFIAGGVPLTVE